MASLQLAAVVVDLRSKKAATAVYSRKAKCIHDTSTSSSIIQKNEATSANLFFTGDTPVHRWIFIFCSLLLFFARPCVSRAPLRRCCAPSHQNKFVSQPLLLCIYVVVLLYDRRTFFGPQHPISYSGCMVCSASVMSLRCTYVRRAVQPAYRHHHHPRTGADYRRPI